MIRRGRPYLLILPAVITTGGLMGYGLWQALSGSLAPTANGPSFAGQAYQFVLTQPAFWSALCLSLRTAALATLLSLALGWFLAGIAYHTVARRFKALVQLPVYLPHLAAGYLLLTLLGQGGWVSGLADHLGFIHQMGQFPVLVNDRPGVGIVLGYVWKEAPFVMLMLWPAYQEIDDRYYDLASSLGASRWQQVLDVDFPHVLSNLVQAAIILFGFTLGAYEMPFILGATYPQALPVLMVQWFNGGDWSLRPAALALGLVMSGLSMVVAASLLALLRWWRSNRGQEVGNPGLL